MFASHHQTQRFTLLLTLLLAALSFAGCSGPDLEATQAGAKIADQLAAREADLAAREAALAERERALDARETVLAEEGEKLASHLGEVSEREKALERRSDQVAVRAAGIATREAELARREAAFGDTESRLTGERQTLAESRAAVEREAARQAEIARKHPPAVYTEVALAPQTRFEVEFLTTVSSATSRQGDTFVTRLTQDLRAGDGRVVVPAGTELVGTVTEAVPLKRVGGQAQLGLRFGELHLPWGRNVEINASFHDAGRNEGRRDKRVIAGSAAGGAVLGAILDDKHRGRGTLLGAILGAAAGTAASANRAGDEVEIPGGTVVALELDEPASVLVPWKSSAAAP